MTDMTDTALPLWMCPACKGIGLVDVEKVADPNAPLLMPMPIDDLVCRACNGTGRMK